MSDVRYIVIGFMGMAIGLLLRAGPDDVVTAGLMAWVIGSGGGAVCIAALIDALARLMLPSMRKL